MFHRKPWAPTDTPRRNSAWTPQETTVGTACPWVRKLCSLDKIWLGLGSQFPRRVSSLPKALSSEKSLEFQTRRKDMLFVASMVAAGKGCGEWISGPAGWLPRACLLRAHYPHILSTHPHPGAAPSLPAQKKPYWDDPERWDWEGGGRKVQDGEHMYARGRFMLFIFLI